MGQKTRADDYGLPLKQLHFFALCVEQPMSLWSLHPQITQCFSAPTYFTFKTTVCVRLWRWVTRQGRGIPPT